MEAKVEDIEWEPLHSGLGREWDLESEGLLIGVWLGRETVPLEPTENDPRTEACAYKFVVRDTGEEVFVWESYELSRALEGARGGDLLRITLLGRESFTGDSGPRTIKRYRVERARKAT